MFKFLICFLLMGAYTTSIYSFEINDAEGGEINFADFQGKKILLVNIATESPRSSQISSLENLYSQYSDSLVIVAFPSNSFGFESRNNTQIKEYCESQHGSTFYIAGKADVAGEERQPIFNWLASESENGVVSAQVQRDFHKFLIDKDGSIIGLFSPIVDPMDSLIQKAILGIE